MTPARRTRRENVFRDLGFPELEAQHLKVRADLMIELLRILRQRGLNQMGAARLLGVSQPRISDLSTGKIDRFSIDALVAMLAKAGRRVEFSTRPMRRVASARSPRATRAAFTRDACAWRARRSWAA